MKTYTRYKWIASLILYAMLVFGITANRPITALFSLIVLGLLLAANSFIEARANGKAQS